MLKFGRAIEQEGIRLRVRLDELERQIDRFVRGGRAEDSSVKRLEPELGNFQKVFGALYIRRASRCSAMSYPRYRGLPGQTCLELFKLADVTPGSQKRIEWLPGQDSNLRPIG